MENKSYNCAFIVRQTPTEVQTAINNVSQWWTAHTEGSSYQINDTFTVRFGDTWVSFSVTKLDAGKETEWAVTDCMLPWLEDKKEWNNTAVHFRITETSEGTKLEFTHKGLSPELPCYENCRSGWDFYAMKSLQQLIATKTGLADGKNRKD